jgi:ribosomal protein L11 methyltransferase
MGKVKTLDVGEHLRLVPVWERTTVESDRVNIIIDPGPSFGAGDHPTTVMALELLEKAMASLKATVASPTLLDAGTGTGVLAIAGKILGAGFTVGFDVDSAAIHAARRNFGLNALSASQTGTGGSIGLFVGSAAAVKGIFDAVVANLTAPTLIKLCPDLVSLVGRVLILSGIADSMEREVLAAYERRGLRLARVARREGWTAALFEKPIR